MGIVLAGIIKHSWPENRRTSPMETPLQVSQLVMFDYGGVPGK